MVLSAALVAFWRQVRYFNADAARAQRYRLAAPLAVLVGQSVTGKSQDVVQVLTFLARFAGDAPKLAEALRTAGVTVEDADQVTGSLFARLDDLPDVKMRRVPAWRNCCEMCWRFCQTQHDLNARPEPRHLRVLPAVGPLGRVQLRNPG